MAERKRSVSTTASPQRVWNVWSDTSTWPAWNPDMEAVNLDGAFASGTTGTMRTRSGGTHHIILEDVQAGRGFTVNSDGMPMTRLRFRCQIAPTQTGSEISQAVSLHGGLAWLFNLMAVGQIVKTFPPLLEGLARYAEDHPATEGAR